MGYRIRKENLIHILLIMILMLLVLVSESMMFNFIVTSYIVIKTLLNCFSAKNYLYLLFIALTYELLIVMSFLIHVVKLPETSWRIQYASSTSIGTAFTYIYISLMVICFVYYATGVNVHNRKVCDDSDWKKIPIDINQTFLAIYMIFCVIYIFIYIRYGGLFSVRDYARGGNSSVISVYRILQVVYISMFFYGKKCESTLLKCIQWCVLILFIGLDLISGFLGYRFMLVELLFLLFFLNQETIRHFKVKHLCMIGIGLVFGYVIMTAIRNDIRNTTDLLESFFRHERNIFYGLVAIIDNRAASQGVNTYLNSILSVLPVSIGVINLNTGHILLPYIQGRAVMNEGMSMGAFYLSEAYFNYGAFGIILVCLLAAILMSAGEKKKYKHKFRYTQLIYFFVVSQMYNIIYYGSSNYMKIIIYFTLFVYLYCVAENMIRKKK